MKIVLGYMVFGFIFMVSLGFKVTVVYVVSGYF